MSMPSGRDVEGRVCRGVVEQEETVDGASRQGAGRSFQGVLRLAVEEGDGCGMDGGSHQRCG